MRPVNPGAELDKIRKAIDRLEAVLGDHGLIMGPPPTELDLRLWTDTADHLGCRLRDIYQERQGIVRMRYEDFDRLRRGLEPLHSDVPGVVPLADDVPLSYPSRMGEVNQ